MRNAFLREKDLLQLPPPVKFTTTSSEVQFTEYPLNPCKRHYLEVSVGEFYYWWKCAHCQKTWSVDKAAFRAQMLKKPDPRIYSYICMLCGDKSKWETELLRENYIMYHWELHMPPIRRTRR